MHKKCLIVSSTNQGFPRGALEIATFLEHNGCPTALLPLWHYVDPRSDASPADPHDVLRSAIRETKPDVIGVSNRYTPKYPECERLLAVCKEEAPDALTVIGGPHVTYLDTECIESPHIDVVVRGEGEWAMLDIVNAVAQKRELGDVLGITFKQGDRVVRTPARPPGDLSQIPPVNFHLLPREYVERAYIDIMLTRGCWYRCRYCVEGHFWGKPREFPVERAIHEMTVLRDEYGRRPVYASDSMVTMKTRAFLEWCHEAARRGLKLDPAGGFSLRVEAVNPEVLEALGAVGTVTAALGVESASEPVLKMSGRTMTLEQITRALELLREHGFGVRGNWIIGLPGDNPARAEFSLDTARSFYERELIRSSIAAQFVPYPGTPFFHDPAQYGVEILTYDWEKWDARGLGILDAPEPVCQLTDFTADQIKVAHRKFNAVVQFFRLKHGDFSGLEPEE